MQQREIKVKDYKYFTDLRKNGKNQNKDLVQGITPYKSLSLVYGGPKSCKSLIELCKCICMSRGIKFLGKYKTTKIPCLYIDLENSEKIIDERELALKKFLKKRKHNVYFITRENNVNILDRTFQEELKKVIIEREIKYIVLDTLPKSAPYDCKEEREVNNLFISFFQPFIDEFNLSICFILHTTKKGDSFLGSQAYKGITDSCFEFKKTYDKGNTVNTEIYSDNRGANFSLGVKVSFDVFEDKDGYSHLKGIEMEYYEIEEGRAGSKHYSKNSKTKNPKLTQDILSLFKENEKLQKSNLILGLKNLGYDDKRLEELSSSIKRKLGELTDVGTLIMEGVGKSTYYELNKKQV